jgi:hypothetical protein
MKVAMEHGNQEIVSYLLDYKNRKIGYIKPPVSKLSLSAAKEKQAKPKQKKPWGKPKTGSHQIGRYQIERYQIGRYRGDDTEVVYPTEVYGVQIDGIANTSGKIPENYKKIKSVVIPEGYTYIGINAFRGCEELENITLPQSLLEIGTYAFYACKKLKTITLPPNIKKLGREVFYGCELDKVVFPSTMSCIPKKCFDETKIARLYYYGTKVLCSDGIAFRLNCAPMIYTDAKVNITGFHNSNVKRLTETPTARPQEELEKDFQYTVKSDETIRIVLYLGTESIVVIPDTIQGRVVSEIGGKAFAECEKIVRKNIKKVILSDNVKVIAEKAFADCEALEEVVLGNGLESIATDAFDKCAVPEMFLYETRFFLEHPYLENDDLTVRKMLGDIATAKNGDVVSFGQVRKWIVLEKKEKKALLLSEECITRAPFVFGGETLFRGTQRSMFIYSPWSAAFVRSWKDSNFRSWLNDKYFKNEFSENERKYICETTVTSNRILENDRGKEEVVTTDKVFLLSLEEVKKYFPKNNRGVAFCEGEQSWWTRTMVAPSSDEWKAPDAYIVITGDCDIVWHQNLHGIRPAFWVDISDAIVDD